MVTLDHRPVQIFLILGFMLAGGVFTFRFANKCRRLQRVLSRFVAVLLVAASGMLLFIGGCISVTTKTEADVTAYSPDRAHAIVVRRWDAGPPGGSATYVNLYSYGGLREETIAGAEWEDEIAIRWNSNNEVELYGSPFDFDVCKSAASVHVRCSSTRPGSPDVK